MRTLVDDLTPERVNAARPQDRDALLAWMTDHGITPNATLRVLVHQDGDALTATVTERPLYEPGYRFPPCEEECNHDHDGCKLAPRTLTVPVASPPPVVWAIDPVTYRLLGPSCTFTREEWYGTDDPPWEWPACPHCGSEVVVFSVDVTELGSAKEQITATEWECIAEGCLEKFLLARIAERRNRTVDPIELCILATWRQLVTDTAPEIGSMHSALENDLRGGGISQQEFLGALARPFTWHRGFQQRWRT